MEESVSKQCPTKLLQVGLPHSASQRNLAKVGIRSTLCHQFTPPGIVFEPPGYYLLAVQELVYHVRVASGLGVQIVHGLCVKYRHMELCGYHTDGLK